MRAPLRLVVPATTGLAGAVLLCNALLGAEHFRPQATTIVVTNATIQVGQAYHHDISPPLRELAAQFSPTTLKVAGPGEGLSNITLPFPGYREHHESAADRSILGLLVPEVMPAPILNFTGIPYPSAACGCFPPDANGAVGASQYVQAAGESYQVFNKTTGASILGPAAITTVWAGFGGACESWPQGSAIILYDKLASRWLISQLAGSPPTDACIAVSTTSDATGTYNRYGFHLGDNYFDNSQFGVWPDGYYMSINVETPVLGKQPFAFDRTKMLAGLPATFVTPGIRPNEPFLPADLDGLTMPPAGAPNPYAEFPSNGVYKVFHFHSDFVNPANSTFTLFASPPAAPFTPLCPGTENCVPQLDSPDMLDGLSGRLMFRLAYRNLGAADLPNESLVGNYSVNSNGVAGIRWFELKNVTSGPVTVAQENTYQPDATWRWSGSVAMDRLGNLAIGFSASSAEIFPQIRYAGRLVTDPPNTLAQGEAHLVDGTKSQTASSWGAWSALTVDPVDDCTFWYTNEYLMNPLLTWRTRIGSFRFDTCTSSPSPTPTATPTSTAIATPSATPIPQTVNLSTRLRVLTDANVGIGGFIITGNAPKQVLLRGIGPSLVNFGVPNPLADPILELHGNPGVITTVTNDNWRDTQEIEIQATGLAPTNDLESAILVTLDPGFYTALLKGRNNGVGVGLVEVYDLEQTTNSKLGNISTRGFVATGGDIMIAGFILGVNTGQDTIVVRGIGPSLTAFGVPNALADPKLELRNSSGTLIRSNDNWMDDPAQKTLIMAAGLAPTNPLEAAIYATLAPGQYTALLSGVNNGTGVGLVEVYDLGNPTPLPSPVHSPTPTGTPTPTPSASPSPSAGPCVENFDEVTAPALPRGWVASNPIPGNGIMWVTTTVTPDSPPNDAFIDDQDGISDKVLDRTGVMVTSPSAMMSFRNNFNTEMSGGIFWDGYVLEVSTPNISGGDFLDITDSHVGGSFVSGGYTGTIDGKCVGLLPRHCNPLAGRMAWSGNSGGYIDTVINMGPNLAGQTVTLRFRMCTDEAVGTPGVHIDNISITGASCP